MPYINIITEWIGRPLGWPRLAAVGVILTTAVNAADVVWIGGTGPWNSVLNWNPSQVPGPADTAWITNAGTYTVTMPAGTTASVGSVMLGGAAGTQTLALDRATLTLANASLVNVNGQIDFLASQSLLNGAGNLTVNGTVNWPNGTINGAGAMTIGSNGLLAIGNLGVTLGRAVSNSGTVTWSGGNLNFASGVTFNNLSTGTFEITAGGHLSGGSGTPFNNAGLLRQAAGTLTTIVGAPLNNSGTVQVLASTLSLNLGGTHTGSFSNAASATLEFGGGNHVLSAGSSVTGLGVLNVNGNGTTLIASGSFGAGSALSVTAGLATLSSTCDVRGTTLNVGGAGAVVNFNSSGSVRALSLGAGTLGGTSPVFVTGPLTLGGGTVTNALVSAVGGLTINGNVTLNGGKLLNPLSATWSAGNITGANGAVISNMFGAVFVNTFDGNAGTGNGALPTFVNAGTFQKTGATAPLGATSIDFHFINEGTVEVQTNTLRYATNQQIAGLTLLDGGGLTAQAQPLQLQGGSLMGTGLVTVANNQQVVNSASVSPGLPLGELDITGNYMQTAAGMLKIELGGYLPGTNYDLLTVTGGGVGGVAALGGTLNVSLVNGFAPTNGATFTFLKAVSRAGSFSAFNYPSNDIGMQLNLDPTSASIKVTNLKPVVANPIVPPPPGVYGASFNFQFPTDTFSDPDNDPLTYTASGMPAGVTFSGVTRGFSGIPAEAGSFPVEVVANDGGSPNLKATNTFVISVNPAVLGVAADPQSKTYGAADPVLTYGVSGLQLGDTAATVLTGALSRASGETVAGGPYSITRGTLAANSNYSIDFTGNTLTITPAPLVVSAIGATKVYRAVDPPFSADYFGFVNGDTPAVLGGTLSFARAPGENVGSYPVTPGGLTSANYAISFNSGTLTITRAPLSVTADPKSKTYGAVDPVFTASYAGFVNGETPVVLGGTLTFARVAGETVGDYLITPGGLTADNYAVTFHTGTLTITKAALSVTADDKTKTYGAADPAFTATYVGFVNGETATVLGGTLSFARAPGENVNSYPITPSGLTSGNYAITFKAGTLGISKASLSVTADDKTKTYGAADPAFSVTYLGFVNSETAAVLSGTLSFARTPGENVGSYPITPSGLASGNYEISFITGTLTVTRAALSVTADNKSKTYGAADPALTVTYAGFVNSETATVLSGTLSIVRAPGETVGSYPITPSGLTSANYAISLNTGTLTITKAALSVTADDKSKTYGSIDPSFTASYTGFVNGEAPAVLGGTLTFARAAGETVGSYQISLSGLTADNYAISFNPGTLTITRAALSVTADSKAKTYGAADPVFTVTYAGFVNGETAIVLSGTLSVVRAPGENVGSYPITPGGLTSGNYAIAFNTGTLAITKAALSVTADKKSKTYGAADPVLTFTASGFQLSDTQASVLSGSLTREAGETVAGSPYAITEGTLAANGNYTISFTGSSLTVSPASLTVAAQDKSKTYGAADPAFTVTYAGFVNGETEIVLSGTLSVVRAPGENVGSYTITPSGLTSGNYAIVFNPGTLTITKAALSVTADNKTKTYGAADPAFTATYAGFVNGETPSVLGGALAFTRTQGESVGNYPITPSGLTSDNYAIAFSAGNLEITPPSPLMLPLSSVNIGNVMVSWTAVSNVTYRVQYKMDLSVTDWTDLPGDVTATNGVASTFDAQTTGNRFYRVMVVR